MSNKPNQTNLAHNLNISSKFTGTGGNCSSLAPKRPKVEKKVPKTDIFSADLSEKCTLFKKYYDRGDLPISVSF